MDATAARPFLGGLTFGEGPRWRAGRLWFSDFFTTSVCSVSPGDGSGEAPPPGGGRRHEMTVAGRPSGIGWLPDGRLLAVSMAARALIRREPDGATARHADLASFAPHSANDLLVHPDGHAYVGHFGFDIEAFFDRRARPEPASLLLVARDGSVAVAADDLWFPNGMALVGSTLVVAETFAGRLSAFEVGPAGRLGHRRVWANLDGRHPDGLCADAEGAIWVADAGAAECLRVEEGGRVLETVTTSQPCYACALGGADRTALFCCTAPTSRAGARAAARDGRIEVARVSVPGVAPVG